MEPVVLTRALSLSVFYLALTGCLEPRILDTAPVETDADNDEVEPGTYTGTSSGEVLFEGTVYSCQGNASVTVDSGGLGSGQMNCDDQENGVDCAIAFNGYDINASDSLDVVFDCYMSETGTLTIFSVGGNQLHISADLTVGSFEYGMVAITTRTD
jgi:hypothetical protein